MDLQHLLEEIDLNIVTPKLKDIVVLDNNKKPKMIAEIIVRDMHRRMKDPVPKDIQHDGVIHKITYFDIEPLLTGVWATVSLMLLQLSYGEQSSIIDSIYPERIKFTAKCFAVQFTKTTKETRLTIENNKELTNKLDSTNSGIAMIIAMLQKWGVSQPNVDEVNDSNDIMQQLAKSYRTKTLYQATKTRADQALKSRDKENQ